MQLNFCNMVLILVMFKTIVFLVWNIISFSLHYFRRLEVFCCVVNICFWSSILQPDVVVGLFLTVCFLTNDCHLDNYWQIWFFFYYWPSCVNWFFFHTNVCCTLNLQCRFNFLTVTVAKVKWSCRVAHLRLLNCYTGLTSSSWTQTLIQS